MKTDFVKRVDRMESKVNPRAGVTAIFCRYVTPGHIDRPVAGWSFAGGVGRVEVLRGEGENDHDLKKRAIALAREHIGEGIPSFTSIT